MVEIKIKTNSLWDQQHHPIATVITSTYNRRELLQRAMKSVDNQTYKDMEYIVVDNGSCINLDDTVESFMATASIPIMYIKRSEGIGPHTGKNSAIKEARGKYITMLDSDDELLPNAIETLVRTWESLPQNAECPYREVVAQCIDEFGNRVGSPFPEELNNCTPQEAFKIWCRPGLASEHVNMNLTQLLKEKPFPEPEGVTWVVDSVILWNRLSKGYKSYFINHTLKRYYVGSADSITNTQINKVTPQHLKNMLFAHKFELNHWDEYDYTFKTRLDRTLKVMLYKQILRSNGQMLDYDWVKQPVKGALNNTLMVLWFLPCVVGAQIFIKKKM
ncbi:MAG: glycosyltransferase family A protein [Bacteroidales bacterium]|nr:glycosyltransferase family A protein [Bacteroidales bacterium]